MRVYVGQLGPTTNEQELREFFAPYNPDSVRIILDRESGQSRGFGFVEIPDTNTARNAIGELNGRELAGHQLQVNEARERDTRSYTSGQRSQRR